MRQKPMYLLSYDHGGYILWGYTFSNAIKSGVEWMDKYKKFKIGLDNEAYCYDRYASDAPENIALVNQVLREYKGRFSIGSCSYGQPLAVFINEESNVRQITEAIKTDQKHFGVRPYVYAISEHALHSQIPQLIKQAGYKMAIMRTHFMMYGYNPTYRSSYGSWFGDDNTAIPTIPTYEGQGAHFAATTVDNYILTRWPQHWHESLEDFEKMFPDTEPLLASRYDDVISRCEELTAHAEEVERYQWVTLEDLFDVYKDCDFSKDEYRPKPNEFKVRMPWGYCGNKIFNDTRKGEMLVSQAEAVSAMAQLVCGNQDSEAVEKARKNLLITQHHDIQICGRWEDEQEFIGPCYQNAEKAIAFAKAALKKKLRTTSAHNVVVINPTGHTVSEQVKTHIKLARETSLYQFCAVCGTERAACSSVVTECTAEKVPNAFDLSFRATVPPFSVRVYAIEKEEIEKPLLPTATYCDNVLKTADYVIKLGSGGIVSVSDTKTGKRIIENGTTGRLFAGVINGKECVSTGSWFVRLFPMQTELCYKGEIGGIPLSFVMKLSDGEKKLLCRCEFEHNNEDIGYGREFAQFRDNTNGFVHEEKLRFVMNVQPERDAFGLRDRPFVLAKTDDQYIEGVYFAYLGTEKGGMAVLNKGSMCLTREKDCVSVPLAYANTYAWGEKRLIGTYSHEFALLPIVEALDQSALLNEARSYNYPLLTTALEGIQQGEYSGEISPLSMKLDENVVLSGAFAENGKVTIRLYEAEGKTGKARIPGKKLVITDLLGNELHTIEGETVSLLPHKIVTVRLDEKGE